MTKVRNWEFVRDWLNERIESGELAIGDPLPTEQELQRATGVGRHSLRRAMAELAAEGRVSVEQGRGSFVAASVLVDYRIGWRTRFHQTLRSQGIIPGVDPIKSEIVSAPERVSLKLGLLPGSPVISHIRRDLANGVPIALDISWHCANRFPDMGCRRMEGESVSQIYRTYGISDYHRKETSLIARNPQKWEARILQQPMNRPVVEQEKLDVTAEGIAIAYSESIWSAGRVRFAIDPIEKHQRG